jgi:hypothetical protein
MDLLCGENRFWASLGPCRRIRREVLHFPQTDIQLMEKVRQDDLKNGSSAPPRRPHVVLIHD